MLKESARALSISDSSDVAVVGDTIADMQAGVAFGAGEVIGVLTGTHDENQLRTAGATLIVHSVADIPSLIQ
jgi:phosphoglycolate phosphatase-like HAD superfamily hydrolase